MNIASERISRLWALGFALVGLVPLEGCLSDDSEPAANTGGAGGAGPATGGTSSTGAVCASPLVVPDSKPAIANFEAYDGSAELSSWAFDLGDDSSTGIRVGTFGYGDDAGEQPEEFAMVEGNDSTYALSISDTLAEEWGGGMGLWISECLDTTAFAGISFWVRGNSPTGNAKLSLMMAETTSDTAAAETPDEKIGTCAGTDEMCVHPTFTFPVTDTWTEIQVAWSAFTAGNTPNGPVPPDGSNVWQIQFDVALVWVSDAAGVAQPTPAEYEFVIDDVAFY